VSYLRAAPLLALVTGLAFSACSSASKTKSAESEQTAAPATGFDVNDISWLFPKNADGFAYPDLKAEDIIPIEFIRNIYQPFLDENVRDTTEFSPFPMTEEEKLARAAELKALFESSRWRVVGVRYDPCGPTADRDALGALVGAGVVPGCLQQLRLVLQPFRAEASGGEARDLDVAAHAVYTLGVGDVTAASPAVDRLTRLRDLARDAGTPLAGTALDAHPVLTKEMGLPAEAQTYTAELVDLIKGLPTARLTQVALFSLMVGDRGVQMAGDGRWRFKGGQVGRRAADGSCTLHVVQPATTGELCLVDATVPVLGPDASAVNVGCNRGGCLITPELVHEDNIAPSLPAPGAPAMAATLHKIDDPGRHHFFSQDCASCHMTTSLMVRRRWGSDAARVAPPTGTSGYLAGGQWASKKPWDFRNFGYFDGRPTSSARTALEAAFAADDLNRQLGLRNPGPDCSGVDAQGAPVEPDVWQCFRDGKEDCFARCQSR
jgi:hypothetical protein